MCWEIRKIKSVVKQSNWNFKTTPATIIFTFLKNACLGSISKLNQKQHKSSSLTTKQWETQSHLLPPVILNMPAEKCILFSLGVNEIHLHLYINLPFAFYKKGLGKSVKSCSAYLNRWVQTWSFSSVSSSLNDLTAMKISFSQRE